MYINFHIPYFQVYGVYILIYYWKIIYVLLQLIIHSNTFKAIDHGLIFFSLGGEARYNYTLPNDLIDGLEDYAAREDAHGLSPETHDVFKRLTRVHGMHYPPADADDATQLFKKLSVLTV